jgi:hypothetical protein
MRLYNIGSIKQMTNSYGGKWDVYCYLGYEPETSLCGETTPRFFFVNIIFKYLKRLYIKHQCIC